MSLTGESAPLTEELLQHLMRTTSLSPGDAARVIADVMAYFSETTEEYVRRRHAELQRRGLRNSEIFQRIRAELAVWLVVPGELSERQLRRIVYG